MYRGVCVNVCTIAISICVYLRFGYILTSCLQHKCFHYFLPVVNLYYILCAANYYKKALIGSSTSIINSG